MFKNLKGKKVAIVAMGKSQLDYHMSISHSKEYDEVWAINSMCAVLDSDSSYTYLLLKHVSWIRDYTPAAATTGEPLYYAEFDDDTFILAPTPNANFTFELHYFYRPASLVDAGDSGTTWLSTNASNTLLYGSLVEAAIFMKLNPAEIQTYDVKYQEGLARLSIPT